MIMRIWHGATKTSRKEKYFRYMMETGVPWYKSLPGNCGVFVLQRVYPDKTDFLLLSLWDSLESVRNFTGKDIDRAIYNFTADKEYLLEMEPTVAHYEILSGILSGESTFFPERYPG
ncbi:MAG: antibiotic biosynthesis monooxygenase [Thermoplasmata archaeon]|nr:antibiotic biosynthesis monooxygenase [Thermoplasmata archaeon]